MVYLAAVLGLRWSEVAGLRVDAIDVLRRTINVTTTTAEVEGVLMERAPVKTKAPLRSVSAPVELVDMLAEQLGAHRANRAGRVGVPSAAGWSAAGREVPHAASGDQPSPGSGWTASPSTRSVIPVWGSWWPQARTRSSFSAVSDTPRCRRLWTFTTGASRGRPECGGEPRRAVQGPRNQRSWAPCGFPGRRTTETTSTRSEVCPAKPLVEVKGLEPSTSTLRK